LVSEEEEPLIIVGPPTLKYWLDEYTEIEKLKFKFFDNRELTGENRQTNFEYIPLPLFLLSYQFLFLEAWECHWKLFLLIIVFNLMVLFLKCTIKSLKLPILEIFDQRPSLTKLVRQDSTSTLFF